jgi:hypothetical protein
MASCLTMFPDEVLLHMLSYLNTVDIIRAFQNINQRFDNLIYECDQHIRLPSDTIDRWIHQHIRLRESEIKTICLGHRSLKDVFDNTRSFPNLQFINVEGNRWNMNLNLENKSAAIVLMSSLNILREIGCHKNTFSVNTPIDVSEKFNNIIFMYEIVGGRWLF